MSNDVRDIQFEIEEFSSMKFVFFFRGEIQRLHHC